MRAFVIHSEGHPLLMESLERQLTRLMSKLGVQGSASWYYDEFSENESGTEYGVRLDIQTCPIPWNRFLDLVKVQCRLLHGNTIEVQEA